MNTNSENPVSVIFGATSTLGRATVMTLIENGTDVVAIGRSKAKLDSLGEDLTSLGLSSNKLRGIYVADATDYESHKKLVSDIKENHGKISSFAYFSGIEKTRPFRNLSLEQFDEVFSVNFKGAFSFLNCLVRGSAFSKAGGSIVLVGSVMSLLGQQSKTAYCASKGALVPFAKSLALELAPRKIRVNVVMPALVETEMSDQLFKELPPEARDKILAAHPLGFGQPGDIAEAVNFLVSEKARWITGTEFVVDGGYSAQ